MNRRLLFLLTILLPVASFAQIKLDKWKFKTGDNASWSSIDFDDKIWPAISPLKEYEYQGHKGYDGFSWYRSNFKLPALLRRQSLLKDSVRFVLAKIDDADETFLNGVSIGKTGRLPDNPEGFLAASDKRRKYVLPWNHPALNWDGNNVIAIRVFDWKNEGGMWGEVPTAGMLDVADYVNINTDATYSFSDIGFIKKSIVVENNYAKQITGVLSMNLKTEAGKITKQSAVLTINPHARSVHLFKLKKEENATIIFSFKENSSGKLISVISKTPYLLTPKASDAPCITNPTVFGAKPGNPFLFTITATGTSPMQFNAKGLPSGLQINTGNGQITGMVTTAGDYEVTFSATNRIGKNETKIKLKIGEHISLTPPMGWNSWNCWGLSVSDEKVKSSANALVKNGLVNYGWNYINIDDGWQKERDTVTGKIVPNEKFPDMKSLTGYIHSLGLKMGIYSSPGPLTCGGYTGSWQNEATDIDTYHKWGVDYLKYDWCSYTNIVGGSPDKWDISTLQKPYLLVDSILKLTKRDIINSVCQYGLGDVWKWGYQVGGNLWRTTDDIVDTWESIANIGFNQDNAAPFSQPGGWNDPDMLTIGRVGWGDKLRQTRLSYSEQYTQISLWAMLSAPLLIGCDISMIDDFTYNLLSNVEVLAIDQDALGKSAMPVLKNKDGQIWVKQLNDGSKVFALFNLDDKDRNMSISLKTLGFTGKVTLRDVWKQKDMAQLNAEAVYSTKVYSHGVVLIKVTP